MIEQKYRIFRYIDDERAYVTTTKYLLIKEIQKREHGRVFSHDEMKEFLKKNTKYEWIPEKIAK